MKRNVLIAAGATVAVTLASALIYIIRKESDCRKSFGFSDDYD